MRVSTNASRAHQSVFIQPLHARGHLLVEIEGHPGSLLMLIDRDAQRRVRELFETAENGMVNAAAETRHAFIADAERHNGGFVQVKRILRFRSAGVFLD